MLDVTKQEDIESIYSFLQKCIDGAGLYALVNNAGINYISPFELVEEAKERNVFEVNFFGAMALTKKLLPLLHQYVKVSFGKAKVINVSSIGGIFGLPWEASYHASKFAMLGRSQSIRYELQVLDVDVCCFLPGGMQTSIFEKSIPTTDSEEFVHPYSTYYLQNLRHMNAVLKGFEKGAATPRQDAKAISKLLEKKMPLKAFFGTDAAFIKIFRWLGLIGLLKGQFVNKTK